LIGGAFFGLANNWANCSISVAEKPSSTAAGKLFSSLKSQSRV
jgi:hypothetical protein